jgi:hypothetical protein
MLKTEQVSMVLLQLFLLEWEEDSVWVLKLVFNFYSIHYKKKTIMKKTIYSILLISLVKLSVFAQAVLPATYSFATTSFPTGWTAVSTLPTTAIAYYAASGNTAPALKFDGTGDMLTINFASAPGNLTYYVAGNSFVGGTFLVEESANGTTWTTLHTHTAPSAGTYTLFTDVPNTLSRYIRFNYSNKVTGNIGLDDVNIAVGAATPAQEINVQYASTTVVNGGSISASSGVGVSSPITFSIQNLGTVNALTISSVSISGTNASDFSVGSNPSSVAALGNGAMVINFNPASAGTRTGIITINSDDADESAYVITINGVGGTLATEPVSQPTSLVFSGVKTYRFNVAYTAASGVDGYVVLRKVGSPVTEVPVDGVIYQRGDAIGNSKVVLSANGTSFTPNNTVANTGYYFAVFAYNGTGIYRNYLITSPLTGNTTTPATMMPAGMYNAINTASATFVTDLHAMINPHSTEFYSSYGNLMIPLFESRDTTGDQRVVTCVYSGENKVYTEPFDWTSEGFSREHSYCHNWMPSNPADNPELPEYDDFHHLFPTNQNNANALRSNYPLGKVVTASSTYLGCKFGLDANGHNVFEPRDDHKGDVARAIMYMSVCYNGVSGLNWKFRNPIGGSISYGQDQEILKTWHFQDPPSNWEISRNDIIDSMQNNRNPFIDNIQYACFVDFLTMDYQLAGCAAGIEEKLEKAIAIYPVPSRDVIYIQASGTTVISYEILDMQSRIVKSENEINTSVVTVNDSNLKSGTYIVKVNTKVGTVIRKMIIE